MEYTNNLGLKKPEETDFYNIGDFNYNADKIDEKLGNLDPVKLLDQIKTVDGEGSGLDADTLDGKHSTAFATSDHKHEMSDINNLKLTAENTTVKDVDNNYVSGTVEGALKELATKDKGLETSIANNKTEVDEKIADLKLSVADGKSKIATSVSGKGVPTNGSDSFQQMADNIDSIIVRSPIAEDEIGVVQWEDGSYKGFKKIDSIAEKIDTSEKKQKIYALNTWTSIFDVDKEKNIYTIGNSNTIDTRTLKKVQFDGTVNWSYIMPHQVKKVVATESFVYTR